LVEAISKGIGDITNGPTAFARSVPALNIFSVYGSYRNGEWPEVEKAVEGTLDKIFVEQGIHLLMSWDSGPALFDHKTKFLKSPEDWKGQKIRLPGRWLAAVAEKWGASPIFMAPPELYLALQRGVLDGVMLPWHITNVFKIYEVAPYVTNSNFSNSLAIMPMNLKKWNSLTKEDQAIFNKAIAVLRPWHDQNMKKEFAEIREGLESKGAKIYDLSKAEMAVYLKDSFAQWPEVRGVSGPLGNELADILMNYRFKME
jgi:TRAP-type C4-dicarboxylate transport system substrate-binding protein